MKHFTRGETHAPNSLGICSSLFLAVSQFGCTTTKSVASKAPSYVVRYVGVDSTQLAACAVEAFDKAHESSYVSIFKGGTPIVVEHWWRLLQPAPMFISKFFSDRVEINGRYNVWGDYGKPFVPIVEGCVRKLNGSVVEQAADMTD